MAARPEVTHLAYEFKTMSGRQDRHVERLIDLAHSVGHPLHLIMRGGTEYLIPLRAAFANTTFLCLLSGQAEASTDSQRSSRSIFASHRVTRALSGQTSNFIFTSLFTHEFGWIDGKRSPGWNGGRCNAKQRHR